MTWHGTSESLGHLSTRNRVQILLSQHYNQWAYTQSAWQTKQKFVLSRIWQLKTQKDVWKDSHQDSILKINDKKRSMYKKSWLFRTVMKGRDTIVHSNRCQREKEDYSFKSFLFCLFLKAIAHQHGYDNTTLYVKMIINIVS